jgi:hypothetical protein
MSGAEKKPPHRQNGESSPLQDFAREVGSTKGTDPIPPDQYLTYQDKRYPPAIRLWAWMLANTIRQGRRKAWAVDEKGNPLNLQRAAADLDMDEGNIRRAWRQLEIENRVRRDGRKLRICGDFKLPKPGPLVKIDTPTENPPDAEGEESEDEDVDAGAKKDPVKKKRSEVCTDLEKPYIALKLNTLDTKVRNSTVAEYLREDLAEKKCKAEAMAAIRGIFAPRKDSILLRVGIDVKRNRKEEEEPGKDDESETETGNQLRFVFVEAIEKLVPEFVQTGSVPTHPRSVQTHPESLYGQGKEPVQTRPESNQRPVLKGSERVAEDVPLNPSENSQSGESSSSAVSLETRGVEKAEEEEQPATLESLKSHYPAKRFDEAKSKILFRALKPEERARAIAALTGKYLSCESWQVQKGRFVPYCSKWLAEKQYDSEPPPLVHIPNAAEEKIKQKGKSLQRTIALARYMKGEP